MAEHKTIDIIKDMKIRTWASALFGITIMAVGAWALHKKTEAPADTATPSGASFSGPGAISSSTGAAATSTAPSALSADYRNATYNIDNQDVTLVNGFAETPAAPGSASKIMTQYFGNETTGDLNGDGIPDVAFLVTQNGGGSGTFFYIVAALKTANGYRGTNGILLGDRIAPQTIQIASGTIVVNYADRSPTQPMTAVPSFGVTKYFQMKNGVLVQVEGI